MSVLLVPLVLGFVLYLVMKVLVVSPGLALQRRFVALGDMRGKNA